MTKIINEKSIDLSALFRSLVRELPLAKKLFFPGLIIILSIYFFSSRLYISEATIAPVNVNDSNAVSSVLASQLGLSGNIEIDPMTIFQSEGLKKSIIYKNRKISDHLEEKNLIQYWKFGKSRWYNPLDWIGLLLESLKSENESNSIIKTRSVEIKTIKKLNKRVSYSQDFYTNEIKISTIMEDRNLAQNINNEIIVYINDFMTNSKNKNAASQAFFLNKRIDEVKNSLNNTENSLEEFLKDNLSYKDSPSLQKIYLRLLRKMEIDTQLIIQLTTQMEVNKVKELSGVSNFVIIDDSTFPAKKIYPKALTLLVYLISSIFITVFFSALFKNFYRKK